MSRALCALAIAASLALDVSSVAARPSLWQRIRDPKAAEQQQLLIRVERLLSSVGLPELDAELSAGAIALSRLGQGPWPCMGRGAADAPDADEAPVLDARLEYLLGAALLDSQTNRESEARCMLSRALRDAPNSPLAAHGLADLAIADAKLGDRNAEHAAYERALTLTWDPDSRANLLANLAESDMALGALPRAIREYRAALLSARQPDLIGGAYFGLAVALDRAGDLPSALAAAKQAISVPLPPSLFPVQSVLDLPNVFFSPSYEVHYYKALGAMAAAELAKDDRARRDALSDAAEHWSAYLLHAELDHTPWLRRASLHSASVARQLRELSKKLPQTVDTREPLL